MFTNQELLLYFNIGFVVFVGFFALVGFIRGTYKSVYYLIVTALVFGLGWVFKDLVIKWLANFNLDFLNYSYQNVNFVTVNQFVPDLVSGMVAGSDTLMANDTMFKALVFGLVQMILRFVFFITLIILSFTIIKFIADIIWLFIRPKKKEGKRPKKSIGSRFGGMGIGALKGVFYMLLIIFPLAGIASITSSISDLTNESDLKYNLVFVGDQVVATPTVETSELDSILDMFDIYHQSLAGKIYNIGHIDTLLFDEMFSFKVGDSKVKLRKELETVANALSKAQISIDSDAGFDQLLTELLEKDPKTLKKIIDEFSKLELINVVVPVAIEFVLLKENEDGSTMLDQLPDGLEFDIEDIYELDFASDIKKLGYAFIDLTSIIDLNNEGGNIDYLNLDPEVVKSVINEIAETEIVKTYAPMGISYLVSSDNVKNTFNELGLSIDDLGLEDIEEWDQEIKKFGNIYQSITELNFKMLDDGGFDFSEVTETAVVNLSNALFESSIIANAIPVLASTLTSTMLDDEMKNIFVFDDVEWDKNEFSSLLNAAVTIMNADLLNINFDSDFSIPEDTINKLAKHLSSSKLMMNSIEGLLDYVLAPMNLGEDIKIGKFDNWSNQSLAELELKSIFGSVNILTSKGLDDVNSFLSLKDNELNVILQSKLISNTLVNVLKGYSKEGKQLEFLVGVDDENIKWIDTDEKETEFTINENIITITKLEKATKYHIYSDGVFVGATRSNVFDFTLLDDIDAFLDSEITVTGFEEGELRKIFIAIGSLADDLLGDGGFSTSTLTNLSDAEIENIVVSDILVLSIIDQLEQFQVGDKPFVVIPEGDLTSTDKITKLSAWKNRTVDSVVVEGEMVKLFKGLRLFLEGYNIDEFSTDMITNLDDQVIYEMLSSEVIAESIIMQIDSFSDDASLPIKIPNKLKLDNPNSRNLWNNVYEYDEDGNNVFVDGKIQVISDGEITKLLQALKYIFNGGSVENFDISVLYGENQEGILKSEVLSETIVQMIVDETNKPDSMLYLPPNAFLNDVSTSDDRSKWYNSYVDGVLVKGEIAHLIDAAKIVTGGGSFENIDFDLDVAYEKGNQEIILKSMIISETIVQTIKKEVDKPESMLYLPPNSFLDVVNRDDNSNDTRDKWYNRYVSGVLVEGEIARLLDAAKIITGEAGFENIDFDLKIAYEKDNQELLLSSKIISETIVQAIKKETDKPESMLYLPPNSFLDEVSVNNNSNDTRNKWYNFVIDGVLVEGEIARLLDAAKIITGEDGFENIDFDLKVAYDKVNQELLLNSKIISETIVQAIKMEADKPTSMLSLPPSIYLDVVTNEISTDTRDNWYNRYVGGLLVEGEIARLLDAAKIITGEDGFENIDFDLKVAYDKDNQNLLLKSKIISETIVQAIKNETQKPGSMLYLPPTSYLELVSVNDNSSDTRDGWYNNVVGEVLVEGEIARLLDAAKIITGEDGFENINFDLKVAYEKDNQKLLLNSKIISETIVQAIKKETQKPGSMLYLAPTSYLDIVSVNDNSTDTRDKWYNQIVDEVLVEGEIARLLDAAKIITGGNGFENINFDISVAYDKTNRDLLLNSKIISETIVQAIKNETQKPGAMLYLAPSKYLDVITNEISTDTRSKWYNKTVDGLLVEGEIARLLDAAKIITGGTDFANINFDVNIAFGANQNKLLDSYVISESIVHLINNEMTKVNAVLVKPSQAYVEDIDEIALTRDLWYNKHEGAYRKGEIAHFLDAIYEIIGVDGELSNMDFSINMLFDKDKQTAILKSAILSETIVNKILGNEDAISDVPNTDLRGRSFKSAANRDAWFNIYQEGGLVQENEIVKFLDSINIILGGASFETLGTIDVDYILDINFDIIVSDQKVVTSSKVKTMLDSMIVEKIVANSAQVIADVTLVDYLDPADGYNWLKADVVIGNDPDTFNEALYDLEPFMNSLFLMKQLNIDYNEFSNIDVLSMNSDTIDGLSEAVVVSRVFKRSISKMFNNFIDRPEVLAAHQASQPVVDLDPPHDKAIKKAWEDVQFNQNDYTGDNLSAYNNLRTKLNTFNQTLNGNVGGFPHPVLVAFYDIIS